MESPVDKELENSRNGQDSYTCIGGRCGESRRESVFAWGSFGTLGGTLLDSLPLLPKLYGHVGKFIEDFGGCQFGIME
jgi:hypothetical protein